jgi:hypothetical protein
MGDSIFALGAAGLGWFVLGLKAGWSLGSSSAIPSPALVESFAENFRFLVFSERQVRFPLMVVRS